jgi:hypothetical protein
VYDGLKRVQKQAFMACCYGSVPALYLEGMRKTTRKCSQNSWSAGSDLKLALIYNNMKFSVSLTTDT